MTTDDELEATARAILAARARQLEVTPSQAFELDDVISQNVPTITNAVLALLARVRAAEADRDRLAARVAELDGW
jgi:hypothetical protein